METQMNEVGEETVLWNHLFRSMDYRLNQWPIHNLSNYVLSIRGAFSKQTDTWFCPAEVTSKATRL